MDGKPPMIPDPESMSMVMLGGYLPPTDQYSTFIHLFPGNNAHAPWGTSGHFHFEVTVYVGGKETGRIASPICDEKGNIRVELNPAAEGPGKAVKGMFVVHSHHAREIPVEVYAFHIHKATGTYVSCNITPFIGDQLYPAVHSDQMENTLFWPGIIADQDNDPYSILVNPYDVAMGYQIHLITPEGETVHGESLKLRPKQSIEHSICGMFERYEADIRKRNGRYSFCVSSQYKLVTYFMLKNKPHQVIAMMDHLHNFCLA
ncbi:MAG: hypothetical protein JWP91_1973 [Fibrobacteres bacterium]|nr:hypothetical protein [Fibrobacterota bacterium]